MQQPCVTVAIVKKRFTPIQLTNSVWHWTRLALLRWYMWGISRPDTL